MARSSIIITGEVLQLNTHGSLQVSQLGVVQWLQLHMLHSLVLKEKEMFMVEIVQGWRTWTLEGLSGST